VATVYGIWLVYAAGPTYLFMAAMLYAPGIIFYVMARRERGEKSFTTIEALIAVALVVAGVAAAYLIWNGSISPL
jgi:arginine:ornithine antiporter/lysine permease